MVEDGAEPEKTSFLGVKFDNLDLDDAMTRIVEYPVDAPFAAVVTPNADHIVRIHRGGAAREFYDAAWLCLNDSRVIALLARMSGVRLKSAPGSDLAMRLFETGAIGRETPICVVGGAPEMIQRLEAMYGLARIDHISAPMGLREDAAARERIVAAVENKAYRYTFLVVGSPQQEMIAAHLQDRRTAHGVGLCFGGSLEFLTGFQQRAPRWMRALALEWLHRLATSPRRLGKRYLLDSPQVLGIWIRSATTAPGAALGFGSAGASADGGGPDTTSSSGDASSAHRDAGDDRRANRSDVA